MYAAQLPRMKIAFQSHDCVLHKNMQEELFPRNPMNYHAQGDLHQVIQKIYQEDATWNEFK